MGAKVHPLVLAKGDDHLLVFYLLVLAKGDSTDTY